MERINKNSVWKQTNKQTEIREKNREKIEREKH